MIAKLFGEGDDQIVFVKANDDEGSPAIRFTIETPGSGLVDFFSVTNGFTEGGGNTANENRDNAFDMLDEEKAFRIRDEYRKRVGELLKGD